MSTPRAPREPGGDDPRLRAARYRDGLDVETLAALSGRELHGSPANPAGQDGQDAQDDGRDSPDAPITPSRPGGEAAALSATVEAVARTAIDRAIAAGAFENLAYAGRPLPDIVASSDPEWWTKSLLRREEVHATEGLGPEALLLRVLDARLEEDLDALASPAQVREALEAFNHRIVEARRQLLGGPPVITPVRDVEAEVLAWSARRTARAAAASARAADGEDEKQRQPRRWWHRRG